MALVVLIKDAVYAENLLIIITEGFDFFTVGLTFGRNGSKRGRRVLAKSTLYAGALPKGFLIALFFLMRVLVISARCTIY